MAMLAEPKRKQKWSLNPRGKEWSEDANKFGQKMLEKMGWKSGKGLGANLDGMTDHVKVSYKHDNKGMGFKEKGDQWTEHDKKFSELLENLGESNAVDTSDVTTKSLEEISATSKKRVHYRKFTRGKDLSQYSEKQLANIFGKKSLKHKKSDEDNEIDNNSLEVANVKNKKYGVDTVEGGSMVDYFKNKIGGKFVSKGISNSGFEIGSNGVLKKVELEKENSDWEAEIERPSYGFGFQGHLECEVSENNVKSFTESETKKNKKRKFNKENLENLYDNVKAIFNESISDNQEIPQDNIEENIFEVKPKIKKIKMDVSPANIETQKKLKKKKSKQSDINSTIDTSEVIIEEKMKIKKKKKNKITPINDEDSHNTETKIKKKKSKKIPSYEENLTNGNIADSESTLPSDITPDILIKKIKKNKRNSSKIDSTIQECISEEEIPKKKSKKPKNLGFENPNFNLNDSKVSFNDISNDFEVERKAKKHKKSKKTGKIDGLDNPGLNVSNVTEHIDDSYQEGLSMSMQQDLFQGIENLALNISANDSIGTAGTTDVIECDLMLNVAGLPNSAQKKQVERTKSVRFSGRNQEFIIPSNYENKLMEQKVDGLANAAFDERLTTLEENMLDMEHHLSTDCAKVENDLNEVRAAAHARLLVPIIPSSANVCHGNAGVRSLPEKKSYKEKKSKTEEQLEEPQELPEVGEKDCLETNVATPNGNVRLSYKLASLKLSNVPMHLRRVPKNTDRASYKHLIKGDIILAFRKSNLHEIAGYGSVQNVPKKDTNACTDA